MGNLIYIFWDHALKLQVLQNVSIVLRCTLGQNRKQGPSTAFQLKLYLIFKNAHVYTEVHMCKYTAAFS